MGMVRKPLPDAHFSVKLCSQPQYGLGEIVCFIHSQQASLLVGKVVDRETLSLWPCPNRHLYFSHASRLKTP